MRLLTVPVVADLPKLSETELGNDQLILRPPSGEDLDGWARFSADAETMRFLGGVRDRAESWRALCTMALG